VVADLKSLDHQLILPTCQRGWSPWQPLALTSR
jgi:hypothetical protein